MVGLSALIVLASLADGQLTLTDVGTGAVLGGLLGEVLTRLAVSLGREWEADGWREGMFYGALLVLTMWLFREMGA